jgi:pre-rRNA-processing protein TSR3
VGAPRIIVYHANQCDPSKCTGLRLGRMNKASIVHDLRQIPSRAVILNPVSEVAFSPADRKQALRSGLAALDCSWKLAEDVFRATRHSTQRALPYLLASNPVNTYKPLKLSTAEALAAALYISGFQLSAEEMMSIFKWGPSFITLNKSWLDSYAQCESSTCVVRVQSEIMKEHSRN